jgi:hypothetical protein
MFAGWEAYLAKRIKSSPSQVTIRAAGREKRRYLNPVPVHEICERWISSYEQGRGRSRPR